MVVNGALYEWRVIRPEQPPPPGLAPWARFGIGPLDIKRHGAFSNVR